MFKKYGLYDPSHEHDACGVGFIVRIDGTADHTIVQDGLSILKNLEHRGAIGGDMKTGDGAGMLMQIPHAFFSRVCDFELPAEGEYGVGMAFLPHREDHLAEAIDLIKSVAEKENYTILGWRDVPVNADVIGELARQAMPSFTQVFFETKTDTWKARERELYVLRKIIENAARKVGFERDDFYFASMSSKTIIYKGMFVSTQFGDFYPDLDEEDLVSSLALVHARFSTNTFPSWSLSQPFRYMAHNGEINTLRRNLNNMKARESTISSEHFGDRIKKLFPIAEEDASDSATFDNVFELLHLGGRSLEHSIIMMVPEAFGQKYHISEDKRAFFEYHAAIMEPWDGPAAIAFSDGVKIGATLDRNGLRPGRYIVRKSGYVVYASEVGVLDIPPEDIQEKGRLAPGKMIMVDTEKKRFIKDNEIKASVSRRKPYRHWLSRNRIELKGLLGLPSHIEREHTDIIKNLVAFGYTLEDLKTIVAPMVANSQEPVGSMGNDNALAVLSRRPQLLFDYFRQLFAQVTNPPIDPYRENLVMSLMSFVGVEKNLLDETPEHCRQLKLAHPILTNDDIDILKTVEMKDFPVCTVPTLFEVGLSNSWRRASKGALRSAVDDLCQEVEEQVDNGYALCIMSDRGADEHHVAIPSLLAVSSVHHYLVRVGKRHRIGLIVESGEPREVQHFATLIGYGASGINPYLIFESLGVLKSHGYIPEDTDIRDAIENYINAVKKGVLKVMSKMGISTLRSYRGSQIFEAIGLQQEFVDQYFTGTSSRIEGVGMDEIEAETLERHRAAYIDPSRATEELDSGGKYAHRVLTKEHNFTPEAMVLVQKAMRNGDYATFKQYTAEINDFDNRLCTLRGLFRFKQGSPVPIEEVESEESIIKRFVSSAMSMGSISKPAHETIAIAMNRLGANSNSGEGGEDEERYIPLPNGDSKNSNIKQVASGRFGVTSNYLVHANELQIKMAQGAKPGEGGQLPGHKVNEYIAKIRHSTPGVMLISPPPHHDIYSIEDLGQLIYDLKCANPAARVSVKLVSEVGVGTIAAGVAKAKADMVLISGSDGGTGASPLSSIMYAGSAWELGLAETQQVLVMNKLRDQIRVQTDGQMKTGRDVVIGALLGAEEFGFGTMSVVAMGCIMMRKCHLNTCPVGVATQDPELQKRFAGKPEYLVNFMTFIAREVREYMAELGFRTFDEMVGRSDMLEVAKAVDHYKAKGLDFSRLLEKPDVPEGTAIRCTVGQEHSFGNSLDPELIQKAKHALENKKAVKIEMNIRNLHRTTGAMLSSEVSKAYGSAGLPDDCIDVSFTGSAGQSFGAFLAPGITFRLEGEANDYFGKGLSGGRIAVKPPAKSTFIPERNIIIGNVALFGATGGEAYIRGMAGERFCVRNSGAIAVVEGVGDHCCEYMTGGRAIILGDTGINFAAGMSGGIAYVLDRNQLFDTRCNLGMVDTELLSDAEDIDFLKTYITRHVEYTGSQLAAEILENWQEMVPLFVKVMPTDYKAALEWIRDNQNEESDIVAITEEVFI